MNSGWFLAGGLCCVVGLVGFIASSQTNLYFYASAILGATIISVVCYRDAVEDV